jgi:hypothetical protein
MKRLFVVACLFLTASLTGQVEHAPTVAQCQADQRLWFSELEEKHVPKLPELDVLGEWAHEMHNCEKVDPDNRFKYQDTMVEIDLERLTRLTKFIDRHGLWNQFKAEDAAGQR